MISYIAIGIDQIDGFFENAYQDIFFEYTYNQVIYDLRQAPYVFTANTGNYLNCFVLR
jgi:hypothetical protein